MSERDSCLSCEKLKTDLNECQKVNQQLQQANTALQEEVNTLKDARNQMESKLGLSMSGESLELDLKKGIGMMMLGDSNKGLSQSQVDTHRSDQSLGEAGSGNLKKLQYDLRISKKAEQLAKDKLTQIKKQLERNDKEFAKYKEEAESRLDSLKNELGILQKHNDQLQTSVNESEIERNTSNCGNDKSTDLLKVIEDYSRQIELKGKENEQLSSKVEQKKLKIDELKKTTGQQEQKISRQKSALDSIKMFLKVLNSNFSKSMNSMKQQNQLLKDAQLQAVKSYNEEIEALKISMQSQILKILSSKEKQFKSEISKEGTVSRELKAKLEEATAFHQKELLQLKEQFEAQAKQIKEEAEKEIGKAKEKKMRHKSQAIDLKNELNSRKVYENQSSEVGKLTSEKQELERNLDMIKIKVEADKQKWEMLLEESKKELSAKDKLLEEKRVNEEVLKKKIEEIEQRNREEVKQLLERIDKIDNEKLNWYQKESQAHGQRETERVKEVREILENKVKDREEDISRLREANHKLEGECQQVKEHMQKELDASNFKLLERENEFKNEKLNLEKLVQEQTKEALEKEQSSKENLAKVKDLETQIREQEFERRTITMQVSKYIKELEELKEELRLKNDEETDQIEKEIKLKEDLEEMEKQREQFQIEKDKEIKGAREQFEKYLKLKQDLITKKDSEIEDLNQQINKQKKIAKEFHARLQRNQCEQEIQTESPKSVQFQERADEIIEDEREEVQEQIQEEIQEEVQKREVLQSHHTGQEEESFSQTVVQETIEKKIIVKDYPQDMAMRGPRPGAGRPPPPRMAGPRVTGRPPMTMGRPMGTPPMPRPTVVNPQTFKSDLPQNQQPLQEGQETQPEEEKKEMIQQNIQTPVAEPLQAPREEIKSQEQQEVRNDASLEQAQQVNEKKETKEEIKEEVKQVPQEATLNEQLEKEKGKSDKNQQQSLFDFRNNRFFGMINGFLGFLTRRKQGYTGRPSSAVYYDEKKGRYIIQGEEESDDDVPPPPPPRRIQPEEIKEEAKQVPEGPIGADQLATVAFGGPLANRNRGRGRGGPLNRFPQSFGPGQISQTEYQPIEVERREEEKQEEAKDQAQIGSNNEQEASQLYKTTLDVTYGNMTMLNQTVLNQTQLSGIPEEMFTEREGVWTKKFQEQHDKISSLKIKILRLEHELVYQREENEQTIVNFEVLCQDLKFKGMGEVEDLQTDISLLQDQFKKVIQEKAMAEMKVQQLEDSARFYEKDAAETREQLREIKMKVIQQEIEQEMALLQKEEEIRERYLSQQNEELGSQAKMLDLESEKESLKWENCILQAELMQKNIDFKEYKDSMSMLSEQINQARDCNQRLEDENTQLQIELRQQNEEMIRNSEQERQNMKEWIQKLQQERINELSRKKVLEYEQRIQKAEEERYLTELKVKQLEEDHARELQALEDQYCSEKQRMDGLYRQQQMDLTDQITDLSEKLAQAQQSQQQSAIPAQDNQQINLGLLKENVKQKEKEIEQLHEANQKYKAILEQADSENQELKKKLSGMTVSNQQLQQQIIVLQAELKKREELLIQAQSEFDEDAIEVASNMSGIRNRLINDEEDESLRGGTQSHRNFRMYTEGRGGGQEDEIGGMGGLLDQQTFTKIQKQRNAQKKEQMAKVEEMKGQVKDQIKEKLKLERVISHHLSSEHKVLESIKDVFSLVDGSVTGSFNDDYEQSSAIIEGNSPDTHRKPFINRFDEMLKKLMEKFFEKQRSYEEKLSDLNHSLEMMKLQFEESENWKFDLEIAIEERKMLEEQTYEQMKVIKELQAKVRERQNNQESRAKIQEEIKVNLQRQELKFRDELAEQQQESVRVLEEERQSNRELVQTYQEEFKKKIQEMKEKQKTRYQILSNEFEKFRSESIEQQTSEGELKEKIQLLEDEAASLKGEKEREEKERKQAEERLKLSELQIQELQNEVLQNDRVNQSMREQLQEEMDKVTEEKEKAQEGFDNTIEAMKKGFQELIMSLKAKNDDKKNKIKELIAYIKDYQKQQEERNNQSLQETVGKALQEKEQELAEKQQRFLETEKALSEKNNELQTDLTAKIQENQALEAKLASQEVSQEAQEKTQQREKELQVKAEEEKEKIVKEYTEREEQFKQQTEQLAKLLKEKINKEKTKAAGVQKELQAVQTAKKQLEEQIGRLQEESPKTSDQDVHQMETKLSELMSQNTTLQGQVEEKQKEIASLQKNQQDFRKRYEEQKSVEELMLSDAQKIIKILDPEAEVASWKDCVDKLQELIQNYDEDKRSLQKLISEKGDYSEEISRLSSENSRMIEEQKRQVVQTQGKEHVQVDMKLKQLLEEKQEMRSDFLIKIHSFEEEISDLKLRLSRYQDTSGMEKSKQYTFIQEPSEIQKVEEQDEREEGEEEPDSQVNYEEPKSGIFNSIASFFLTESEMEPKI